MIEKVGRCHPDKIADRIAGAIVDLAYVASANPHIAVEVLIGHGKCNIVIETDVKLNNVSISNLVKRITGDYKMIVDIMIVPQDARLNKNQNSIIRCGDNGIFKGVPTANNVEQKIINDLALALGDQYDGKYIVDLASRTCIICQSNMTIREIHSKLPTMVAVGVWDLIINPIGSWRGGLDVDTGATNRKLGSDMGFAVTGGGLHGKDLSKADVSVNIYAHLKAKKLNKPVSLFCAIGYEYVDGKPYSEIVDIAREYIRSVGGFEKFAEWGFID